ncbi:PKD domain-containing protein [Candidatus Berkelbacteria bacterium]|nr:PKD domain-containing protein [Candidatus Berkelbacteria bacterium]
MKRSASAQSRLTTVFAVTGVLFLVAILVWAFRTGRLGSEASVSVAQNRVSMNFDELTTPAPPTSTFTQISNQYESYGIKFSTEAYSTNLFYPGTTVPSVSLFTTVWGSANREGLTPSSQPNAIAATAALAVMPDPSNAIIMTFHDPATPSKASTTDYVKFNLNVLMGCDIVLGGNLCNGTAPFATSGESMPVKVTAFNASGTEIANRVITASGTHSVEFGVSGITKVRVDRTTTSTSGGVTQRIKMPSKVILDDLQFNSPATSATTSATLTTSKPEYAVGETVKGTFRNTGTATITCPSPLVFKVIRVSDDTTVFTSPGARDTQTLTTGTSRSVNWDQKDKAGKQVEPGKYKYEVVCTGITKTIGFTILPATGGDEVAPTGTLTTDKPVYKLGETVALTITNTGSVNIVCPVPPPSPIVIRSASGEMVYEAKDEAGTTIEPTKTAAWRYGQKKPDGSTISAGVYAATATCGTFQASTTFTVLPADTSISSTLEFTVDPTSGTAPLAVTATYSGTETCLAWDFGDGTVAGNLPVAQHTYQAIGTYTITLRTCDGTKNGTKQVTVSAPTTPTTTTTLTNTTPTGEGPKVEPATVSPATLVSTGGNLLVNLGIATLLSLIVGYTLLRHRDA